jgi:hypothetical protein
VDYRGTGLMGHPSGTLAYGRPICSSRPMHSMISRLQTAIARSARGLVLAGNNNNRANNNANFWRACA